MPLSLERAHDVPDVEGVVREQRDGTVGCGPSAVSSLPEQAPATSRSASAAAGARAFMSSSTPGRIASTTPSRTSITACSVTKRLLTPRLEPGSSTAPSSGHRTPKARTP